MSVLEESISKKNESVDKNIIHRSITPIFLDDDVDAGIPTGVHINKGYSAEDRELFDIREGECLANAIARKLREAE